LVVDGTEMQLKRPAVFELGRDEPFALDGHAGVIHVRTNGLTFSYDLSVDDRSVTTGKPASQQQPIPKWVWLFVVACAAIPLASLGGGLPMALGAGGAFACVALSRRPGASTSARVASCAGVLVLCWILFIALVVAVSAAR
jgi:hypothetical protein